jgi:hypothetical protein
MNFILLIRLNQPKSQISFHTKRVHHRTLFSRITLGMNELISKQLKFNKKFQYQHFFMRIIFTMLGIFYKWMSNFATERPRTTFFMDLGDGSLR